MQLVDPGGLRDTGQMAVISFTAKAGSHVSSKRLSEGGNLPTRYIVEELAESRLCLFVSDNGLRANNHLLCSRADRCLPERSFCISLSLSVPSTGI